MSGETDVIARHEQGDRALSGGTDADQLAETMERHAPPEPTGGTTVKDQAVETGSPAPAAPVAKPTRGQARFSELAAARDAATARADAAEARAKELEARVSAPPAREPEPRQPAAAEPAKPATVPERFDFPDYDDAYIAANPGKSYKDWEIDRLVAFRQWDRAQDDTDARIERTIAAREAKRELDATIAQSRTKGREAYADFDTVIASGPGGAVHLHADPAKASQRVAAVFLHPQTEHLQYAISRDAALAERLAGLDDIAFGFELARLAPGTATPVAPRRAEPKPIPAPFQPVNGNSATVAVASSELAGKGYDFDTSGYREKRAAERKRAGR